MHQGSELKHIRVEVYSNISSIKVKTLTQGKKNKKNFIVLYWKIKGDATLTAFSAVR